MTTLFGAYQFLIKLYADSGYTGPKLQAGSARVCRYTCVEIAKHSDAVRFVVLPTRWIVEHTIAWLNRCRCLAEDWKRLNHNALAVLQWASIRLTVRKFCQTTSPSRMDTK